MARHRRSFYPVSQFPELAAVQAAWPEIRDEAAGTLAAIAVELDHAHGETWILPLVAEAEDRHVFSEDVCRRARQLAPTTTRLVQAIPYVIAYAFSKVAPGERIPPHEHWNPYLTATLCLQSGGDSHTIVNGERRDFADGELFVFDYTLPHEVANDGGRDRLALLMLIDKKRARALAAQSTNH